jgi:hypothetical protein
MSQAQTPQSIVNLVKVSKKAYNIIRSIVESSTKPIYEFNKPIRYAETVKFVKYRNDIRFWEITIASITIVKDNTELPATVIVVGNGFGRRIAELRLSEYPINSNKYYVLKVCDIQIDASSIYEFEYYVVMPNADLPYAVPISLGDFVNKLMFYKTIALRG